MMIDDAFTIYNEFQLQIQVLNEQMIAFLLTEQGPPDCAVTKSEMKIKHVERFFK